MASMGEGTSFSHSIGGDEIIRKLVQLFNWCFEASWALLHVRLGFVCTRDFSFQFKIASLHVRVRFICKRDFSFPIQNRIVAFARRICLPENGLNSRWHAYVQRKRKRKLTTPNRRGVYVVPTWLQHCKQDTFSFRLAFIFPTMLPFLFATIICEK